MNDEQRRILWKDYLYRPGVKKVFPRQVAFMKDKRNVRRFTVYNYKEWEKLVIQYDAQRDWDCFTRLWSDDQIERKEIDCIFFEMDRDNVQELNSTAILLEMVLENENLKFREFYTASRSKHYYILIELTQFDYPNTAIGNWLKSKFPMSKYIRMKKNGKVGTIFDWGAFGRISQMVRIPYTHHRKTGLLSLESKGAISIDMEPSISRWEVNYGIAEKIKDLDFVPEMNFGAINFDNIMIPFYPKCIQYMIKNIDILEFEHLAHLHLAAFLKMANVTPEECLELFSCIPEFNSDISSYQVYDIYSRNLSPMKCENAISAGICDRKTARNCPMYPYMVAKIAELQPKPYKSDKNNK